ncbi:MAG: MFS transporter, partial [Phycisphaerae bacterium]|nr:MFS transporter [Phycisphaerae bacterium]
MGASPPMRTVPTRASPTVTWRVVRRCCMRGGFYARRHGGSSGTRCALAVFSPKPARRLSMGSDQTPAHFDSPDSRGGAPELLGLRLSVMMFLQYAIWGAWLPILYPFLMGHRGFSLEKTGLCLSAGAIGAIFGPFIAGQLADRNVATEKLLAASHLIGAALVLSLAYVDAFPVFLVLSALYGFVYAPTLALTNSLAFAHLADRDRQFGPIRLWGTIGWIAAGIAVGQVLLRLHTPEAPAGGLATPEAQAAFDKTVEAAQNAGRAFAFQLSAGLGLVMAVFCLTLPHTPPARQAREKLAFAEALKEIRLQPLITLFLISIPVSMIHQFYFIFTSEFVTKVQNAANSAGADKFANAVNEIFGVGGGGLMTIGQMTEIAVLALMPLLAPVVARKWLLAIGLCAYAGRMAIFAFAPQLEPVLFGVALHGLCFGCFIFVAFMVVDEHTTADVRATAQNLYNLVIIGIGIIVGSYFATAVVGNYAMAEKLDATGQVVRNAAGAAETAM